MNNQATQLNDLNNHDQAVPEGAGPIRACVAQALDDYLARLKGHDCADLYRLVLQEVEPPLLEAVMDYCQGNQTRASQLLGMNRGTLRKKLLQYGLTD
ncbi:MAG: DNA-binding transcriptional regulator Fis [Ectothiorhodospiraceae bacterium]|nr:DNA-binding transcriptional regulator Fis [Ectothiorhodospiraceae bacterium]